MIIRNFLDSNYSDQNTQKLLSSAGTSLETSKKISLEY